MSPSRAKQRKVGSAIRAAREQRNLSRPAANRAFVAMVGRGGSVTHWRHVEDGHDGKGNAPYVSAKTLAVMAIIVGLDPRETVSEYGLDPESIPDDVLRMDDPDDNDAPMVVVVPVNGRYPTRDEALREAIKALQAQIGPPGTETT